MADFRYLIDTTKKAMAAHPGAHVIIDSHAGGQVVALCPITEGNEPICEGQYSFAPLVQRALETQANQRATFAKISALVRAAYEENPDHLPWEQSKARRQLRVLMLGTDEMPEHPLASKPLGGIPGTVNMREPGEFGDGATVAFDRLSAAEVLAMLPEPVDLVIVEAFKPGKAE